MLVPIIVIDYRASEEYTLRDLIWNIIMAILFPFVLVIVVLMILAESERVVIKKKKRKKRE